MQPQRADRAGTAKGCLHAVERLLRDRRIGRAQFQRHPVVRQQPGARLAAEAVGIQRRPRGEWPLRADRMQAPEKAADPFEHRRIVQIGCTAATALEQRYPLAIDMMQRAAADHARWHGRHLCCSQLGHERVLLLDLRIAPAARPIELGDHEAGTAVGILHTRLVHAVLVAVEREQRAGGGQPGVTAGAINRVEHRVGREASEGRDGVRCLGGWRRC